jgi:hypothetical protein
LYNPFRPGENRLEYKKKKDRKPTSVRQQFQGSPDTKSQQDGKIEEGNEEVRLIYSTAPEKADEKTTTATPNTQQTINKKLAPILLLASYL